MKNSIIPGLVAIFAFTIGLTVGMGAPATPVADPFAKIFEERTGIQPDSFLAAGSDCENYHQQPCRLYGGWAPLSDFAEEVPE